jgi:hypothetical protein
MGLSQPHVLESSRAVSTQLNCFFGADGQSKELFAGIEVWRMRRLLIAPKSAIFYAATPDRRGKWTLKGGRTSPTPPASKLQTPTSNLHTSILYDPSPGYISRIWSLANQFHVFWERRVFDSLEQQVMFQMMDIPFGSLGVVHK